MPTPSGVSATPKTFGRWGLATTLGLAGFVSAPVAQAADGWRWPGEAGVACDAAGPDRAMDVYVAPERASVGRHIFRRCQAGSPGSPEFVVTTRLRFAKRVLVATLDIAVDHTVAAWRRDGRLIAQARGSGACGQVVAGECRFELAQASGDGGPTLRRADATGERVERTPLGALYDAVWDADTVRAPILVDVYTGKIWTMRGDPAGVADDLDGRPARRHHIKAEPKLTARYERVSWFAADGEVLRVCDFHREFGSENLAEFVRTDLGIMPRHDCARWIE